MTEMFRQGRNLPIGTALGQSREMLMDSPDTSHPFYWAGFAVIGDAARPLLTSGTSDGPQSLAQTAALTSGEMGAE